MNSKKSVGTGRGDLKKVVISVDSIETAPKDGTYVLVFGDSGYIGTPYRAVVAKYDAEFRPHQPWVDYAGDSITDSGSLPTHWISLTLIIEAIREHQQDISVETSDGEVEG